MAFQLPVKGDLDRVLSNLMHESRHRLMDERNQLMGEAAQLGALRSNRVVATIAAKADDIHKDAMKQATPILLDFIQRMQLPPAQITAWARGHLENLGNSLLGEVKPNGFPADHQRLTRQYQAVFGQRLDGLLRDIEIGHVPWAGFARAEQMESKEEWIPAATALGMLKQSMPHAAAVKAICTRAHDGMVRARAERFIREHRSDSRSADSIEIPKEFWWAQGGVALEQNWSTGDFETWINQEIHLRAYSVSFLRSDLQKIIPQDTLSSPPPPPAQSSKSSGGRPPADWWEDCLIDMCFKYYRGNWSPKTQADITRVMQDWITDKGFDAAESTVKIRARKLFLAIEHDKKVE